MEGWLNVYHTIFRFLYCNENTLLIISPWHNSLLRAKSFQLITALVYMPAVIVGMIYCKQGNCWMCRHRNSSWGWNEGDLEFLSKMSFSCQYSDCESKNRALCRTTVLWMKRNPIVHVSHKTSRRYGTAVKKAVMLVWYCYQLLSG